MYTKNSHNRFSSIATHSNLYNNNNIKSGANSYHVESQSVHQINNHIQRQQFAKYGNDPLLKYDPRINGGGGSSKKQQSLPNSNMNSTMPVSQPEKSRSARSNRSLPANANGKSKLCNIL